MQIVKTVTSDDIQLNGLLSTSSNEKKTKQIIIHIHGMAGDILQNHYYPTMHDLYPKNGYDFLSVTNRGTATVKEFYKGGEPVLIGGAYEKFEESIYDIQAWIDFALELGYEEIWLQSHSLGTVKTAYYAYHTDESNIAGLIWISPVDVYGLTNVGGDQAELDALINKAQVLVEAGKGDVLLEYQIRGHIFSAETFLNLSHEDSPLNIFNYWSDVNWDVINSIKLPTLAITGTRDYGVGPINDANKAMEILERELKNSERFQTIVYGGATHTFKGFEERLVEDVVGFVG